MSAPVTIEKQNLDCVLKLLSANRAVSKHGSTKIESELAKAIERNIINGPSRNTFIKTVLTLRVRFFDAGGGVEQITFEYDKKKKKLREKKDQRQPRYSAVDDPSVASMFESRFSKPGVKVGTLKGLMAVLGKKAVIDNMHPTLPNKKEFMLICLPTDLVAKNSKKADWPLDDWQEYLTKGVFMRNERFFKHLRKEAREAKLLEHMHDTWRDPLRRAAKCKQPEYAYFVPVIAWDRVVCAVTFRTRAVMESDQWAPLRETLETFGEVTGVLSVCASPARLGDGRDDLTMPYYQTQSARLWEHKKGSSRKEHYVVECIESAGWSRLAQSLRKVQDKLLFDIRTPLGESEIAQVILVNFVEPVMRYVLCLGNIKDPKNRHHGLYNLLSLAAEGEEKLREIPQYRQHFIHSFHVCVTGLRLLFEGNFSINKTRKPLCSHLADLIGIEPDELIKTWILTSLYHDVAYVATNVHEWVGNYLGKVMMAIGVDAKVGLVANDLARFVRHGKYPRAVDVLALCLQQNAALREDEIEKAECLRLVFQGIMGSSSGENAKLDHGIVSALMLLNSAPVGRLDMFRRAADAIACHDRLWKADSSKETAAAKELVLPVVDTTTHGATKARNYLRDLLVICDNIQQWGRSESIDAQRLFRIELNGWSCPTRQPNRWVVSCKYDFLKADHLRVKSNKNSYTSKLARDFGTIWQGAIATDLGRVKQRFYLPSASIVVEYDIDKDWVNPKLLRHWRKTTKGKFKSPLSAEFSGIGKKI